MRMEVEAAQGLRTARFASDNSAEESPGSKDHISMKTPYILYVYIHIHVPHRLRISGFHDARGMQGVSYGPPPCLDPLKMTQIVESKSLRGCESFLHEFRGPGVPSRSPDF